VQPHVHLHEIAGVRAGLRDQRLALLGHERLVLVAAEHHVDVGRGRQRTVRPHVLVSHTDHEMRARPP
jgi:hypothetical protein